MSKVYRFQRIEQAYSRALANPDNQSIQRDCLSSVFRDAQLVGITLSELVSFFQNKEVSPPAESSHFIDSPIFKCPVCSRGFKTQAALSAHGPARCAQKKKGGVSHA
ncbi:hypothetical protein [Arundinibacter roseus]|uniref:C2H2-type domain-containing protein n=1 Tax=Arundinibacter roseus TaxID=2070510 RepID=A0A4R4KL70_9BACT|nr:hypothetical protein [Arundinibacter roseus]TDB69080.1 hypothetical protein EZE20_01730 [Arundinibacter roseus]